VNQDGTKPTEEAKPTEVKAGEEVVPDYKDLKLPENMQVDEAQFGKFKEIAAAHKLPPQAAQELVGLYSEAVTKISEANTKAWNDLQTDWQKQVRADPEIGGNNTGPALASIAKAIDLVGGTDAKAIREAFDMTGAGNNPALVKFIARLSKGVNEGSAVAGNPQGGKSGRSAASVLYPENQTTS
jgi:hypothetical protein